MCVCRGVSALARPVPRWQLLADGGFAVGQAGGCALGGAGGKAAGRALRWRRIGSEWHAGPSLELGAFPVWGGCTPDSQRGLRGPCAGRVGSGRLELAGGRGHGRSLTCRVDGRGCCLAGRVCICVCVRIWVMCVFAVSCRPGVAAVAAAAGLVPCTPCGCPQLGGRGWGLRPRAVWGEEPQTSGRSTLSLWPSRQMASAAPSASVTSPKPLRSRVCGFKRISQVVGLQA